MDRSLQKEGNVLFPIRNGHGWNFSDFQKGVMVCPCPCPYPGNGHGQIITEVIFTVYAFRNGHGQIILKLLIGVMVRPCPYLHFNFGYDTHTNTKVDTDGTDKLTDRRNFRSALTEWTRTDS